MQRGFTATDSIRSTTSEIGALSSEWVFAPGDRVAGRYCVQRPLAQGGMGQVYEAIDLLLDHRVALKTMHPELGFRPRALERFRREALSMRLMTHANVCRVFEVGSDRALVYLTMELLEGETLASRIRRAGRLNVAEAGEIAAQIIAALEVAHRAGIIHRDFKSANIVLAGSASGDTRAVVTDFGLARMIDGDQRDVTREGGLVGSPAYMSPEQVEGRELTPASDIYSLGVVLYEMVTGVLPFDGETPFLIAARRLTERPVPASEHVPGLDPRWEAAIARCLERDPSRRFPDANAVLEALRGPLPSRRTFASSALLVAGLAALSAHTEPAAEEEPAAAAHYAAAVRHLDALENTPAREQAELALAIDPDFAPAHRVLALALNALGATDRAEQEAELARRKAIGRARREQLEAEAAGHIVHYRPAEAAAVFQLLAEDRPDDVSAGVAFARWKLRAGDSRSARATIERLRSLPPPLGEDPRIDLLDAELAGTFADHRTAAAIAKRAATHAAARSLHMLYARARAIEGWALRNLGEPEKAWVVVEEARRLYAAERESFREANEILTLGHLSVDRGELARARAYYDEGLALALTTVNPGVAATAYYGIANVEVARGSFEEAAAAIVKGRAIAVRNKNAGSMADFDVVRARIHELVGDFDEAERLLAAAIACFQDDGSYEQLAQARTALGLVRAQRGDVAGARRELEPALATRIALGLERGEAETRIAIARVAIAAGDPVGAAEQARLALVQAQRQGARDRAIMAACLYAGALDALGWRAEAIAELEPYRAARVEDPLVRSFLRSAIARLDGEELGAASAEALAHSMRWSK